MYLINHFLDVQITAGVFVPATSSLNQTNAATGSGSVGTQVSTCQVDHGRPPNFILVDVGAFRISVSNETDINPTLVL
jgi:hypothetical protein